MTKQKRKYKVTPSFSRKKRGFGFIIEFLIVLVRKWMGDTRVIDVGGDVQLWGD